MHTRQSRGQCDCASETKIFRVVGSELLPLLLSTWFLSLLSAAFGAFTTVS